MRRSVLLGAELGLGVPLVFAVRAVVHDLLAGGYGVRWVLRR